MPAHSMHARKHSKLEGQTTRGSFGDNFARVRIHSEVLHADPSRPTTCCHQSIYEPRIPQKTLELGSD